MSVTFTLGKPLLIFLGQKLGKPRNLRATVKGKIVTVKWLAPVTIPGDILHYIVTWKGTGASQNDTSSSASVSKSPFVRDFGSKYNKALCAQISTYIYRRIYQREFGGAFAEIEQSPGSCHI